MKLRFVGVAIAAVGTVVGGSVCVATAMQTGPHSDQFVLGAFIIVLAVVIGRAVVWFGRDE